MQLIVRTHPHPRYKDQNEVEIAGYLFCCKEMKDLFESPECDGYGHKPLRVAYTLTDPESKHLKLHGKGLVFCPYCGAHAKTVEVGNVDL